MSEATTEEDGEHHEPISAADEIAALGELVKICDNLEAAREDLANRDFTEFMRCMSYLNNRFGFIAEPGTES